MNKLTVETFILGPLDTNSYLLTCGGESILIDCPPAPQRLAAAVKERDINLKAIYLTHLHFDHMGGVKQLSEQTGADIYANMADAYLADVKVKFGGSKEFRSDTGFKYENIEPGRYTVLGLPMLVLDTPGHTPGSVSYFFPGAGCVFTGDLIFMISVGRTDFPGGDSQTLLDSIQNRIFILPDETRIYSGHGPMTTVAFEKENNPMFLKD
ncbi:MBL fold metallo-hydrolase [Maridesulfovibrio bastinii]|uniref:MBL fold metallo-hydrolase n=1 Tax=Maridesulfovibrio bastinii TaxID=47157 RepID=UPI00040F2078|nr:MBL fold metallo-hydrolase [Maridesulfovibrio bastinii]